MAEFETKTNDKPSTADLEDTNGPSAPEISPSAVNVPSEDIAQDGDLAVAKSSVEPPVPAEDEPSPSSALNWEPLVAQGMQFLATAPPEVLGGVLVGITAVSYMVFGRLALFIAGAMVGMVVHSSWETHRRRNDQHDGVFAWRATKEKGQEAENELEILKVTQRFNSASLPTATAEAIDELTSAVVRDYVKHWYTPLLPSDDNFPNSCKDVLSDTLLRIYSHVSQKRATDSLITFLISTSNILIVFFRELSTALGNGGLGSAPGAAIATYVEDYPSSALSQLLDQDLQKRKYRLAAEDILQTFVDRKAMECSPVRTFLHEIMAGVIIPMTVDKFSEANWINEWIIYFLDEVVPEAVPTIRLGDMTQEDEREIQEMQEKGTTEEDRERERRKEARKSKAEEDLQQAMKEAEDLTRMIEEEDRRKKSGESMREDPMTKSTSSIASDAAGSAIGIETPSRSRANSNAPSTASPARPVALKKTFTSFDQIVSSSSPLPPTEPRDCLHNAFVTIMDLSPSSNQPNSASPHIPLRSKPMLECMLQIEPHSSYGIPGWILTRRYPDFETLHEVLVKLSIISGVEQFVMYHSDVPNWKGSTKEQLRQNLEIYLNDALREKALAQCEGMKKFLEKEGAREHGGPTTQGGNALSNLTKNWTGPKSLKKVGDNVLEALTKGPQGAAQAAQGGKGFLEGVFGGVGGMRRSQGMNPKKAIQEEKDHPRTLPMGVYNPPKAAGEKGTVAVVPDGWVLNEEQVAGHGGSSIAKADGRPSRDNELGGISDFDDWIPRAQPQPPQPPSEIGNGVMDSGSVRGRQSVGAAPNRGGILSAWRGSSPWRAQTQRKPSISASDDRIISPENNRNGNGKAMTDSFPPPPMDMQDDFLDFSAESFKRPPLPPRPITIAAMPTGASHITPRWSVSETRPEGKHVGDTVESPVETSPTLPPPQPSLATQPTDIPPSTDSSQLAGGTAAAAAASISKPNTPTPSTTPPLSEQETQLIIEIFFAILNELFTLSSAWLLRRSLLNVAKNILLRPGNTSLGATRLLIQESLIEANSSDEVVAKHIKKLRAGVFPTPEESNSWQEKMKAKRIEWSKRNGLGVAGGRGEEIKEREYEDEEREERREKARRLLLEKGMPEALKGVMGQAACRECLGKVFDCLQVKSVARGVVGGIVLEVVRTVCQ